VASARVRSVAGELEIGRGASLWLSATDTAVTIEPRAEATQLFLAGDGLAC
jgi:mannose-6-phosphate isomerase